MSRLSLHVADCNAPRVICASRVCVAWGCGILCAPSAARTPGARWAVCRRTKVRACSGAWMPQWFSSTDSRTPVHRDSPVAAGPQLKPLLFFTMFCSLRRLPAHTFAHARSTVLSDHCPWHASCPHSTRLQSAAVCCRSVVQFAICDCVAAATLRPSRRVPSNHNYQPVRPRNLTQKQVLKINSGALQLPA
jgi:hypothetical protein